MKKQTLQIYSSGYVEYDKDPLMVNVQPEEHLYPAGVEVDDDEQTPGWSREYAPDDNVEQEALYPTGFEREIAPDLKSTRPEPTII